MKFTPEKYKLKDEQMKPFIDPEEIWSFIHKTTSNPDEVRKIIKKSLAKQRLSLHDVAVLINTKDEHLVNEIKDGARELKKMIYGNRIVLFAPLYVGNKCQNDCKYCGLRMSNKELQRKTMTREELRQNVISLEDVGQKRLIVVFGEHIEYNAEYIAETIREVYKVRHNNGAIRRANVNAAPFDIEGFKIIKSAGIGTYQIFQETYHPETYSHYHPSGRKADYNYRLTALDRAQEAGIDDVGIGVLFGLYDWRFELLSLLRHVNHLEACYNVGPHTISFPRIQMASHSEISEKYLVSDNDFEKLVAILRLAVPYTGMILTARENEAVRDKVIEYGCSQIDAGTNIEINGYIADGEKQDYNKEQFSINDQRSLSNMIKELISKGYVPSFCTACYRAGRTGEHFMEYSVPGFIHNFCTPNSLLTLAEYLEDYADDETKTKGYLMIESSLAELKKMKKDTHDIYKKLQSIKNGERDLFY